MDILAFKADSCLSNFYACKIKFDGRVYSSSEAAYQSTKTMDKSLRDKFVGLSPQQAKQLGRSLVLRPDWNSVMCMEMYRVLYAKFSQNKECREYLLKTGNTYLIEDTTGWHDVVWGKCYCNSCNGTGMNFLGTALMALRQDLKG